ncbi:MAG: FIST C-terminal domain-containing protein, partial [Snowella sp.]
HLRDAQTSAEDLDFLLKKYQTNSKTNLAQAAFLFSCLGRGNSLYQVPNFDSELFRDHVPDIPLAGFFGSGEIGPVGNRTFLHGYTSAFAVFRSL